MSGLSVAIAGAGIGGLTAALTLSRIGCEVTLVERRTGFDEPGAGIQISPNASRVLIALGLEAPLRRIASEPPGIVIRRMETGREIGAIALGRFAAERYGAPYLVVPRADLQTMLLDCVRSRGIALAMGRRVVAAESGPDRATLTIESAGGGRSSIEADIAVGADGTWSSVRTALGAREPVASGYAAWRATIPCEALPLDMADERTGLWLGRAAHLVHYPIAHGSRLNVVAILDGSQAMEGWSSPGDPGLIRTRFARQAAPLRALIGAAPDWRVWSLADMRPSVPARGRLALIGDAAHPVLPFLAQGGALAIEDAAVLADALQAHPADMTAAAQHYADQRLARIRLVQEGARRNGRIYHLGGMAAWARDLVIARHGPEGMTARYDWLYGWQPPALRPA